MIIVASCPGGNLSNLITHLGRGNTALSVCMTGLSSVVAVVATPLNILFWAGLNPATAVLLRQVDIQPGPFLAQTVLILGLPMALGLAIAHGLPRLALRLRRPFQLLSFAVLVLFIAATTAAHGKYLLAFLGQIMPLVVLHNAAALWLGWARSEEHTSELQSLMRISYAVFCLKQKKIQPPTIERAHT